MPQKDQRALLRCGPYGCHDRFGIRYRSRPGDPRHVRNGHGGGESGKLQRCRRGNGGRAGGSHVTEDRIGCRARHPLLAHLRRFEQLIDGRKRFEFGCKLRRGHLQRSVRLCNPLRVCRPGSLEVGRAGNHCRFTRHPGVARRWACVRHPGRLYCHVQPDRECGVRRAQCGYRLHESGYRFRRRRLCKHCQVRN